MIAYINYCSQHKMAWNIDDINYKHIYPLLLHLIAYMPAYTKKNWDGRTKESKNTF